jgi:hypothetical protein
VAGNDISQETRMIAARIRERAAADVPSADELAGLLTAGVPADGGMSPAEIRRLAADAITRAQQVSYLLGRLAGLLEEGAQSR